MGMLLPSCLWCAGAVAGSCKCFLFGGCLVALLLAVRVEAPADGATVPSEEVTYLAYKRAKFPRQFFFLFPLLHAFAFQTAII